MPPKTSSHSSSVPTFLPLRFTTSMFAIGFSFKGSATASPASPSRFARAIRRSLRAHPLFLAFSRSSLLRSLQRVKRGRSGKATTLARRFLRLQDHHVSILVSRYRAFHQQQVVFRVNAADFQVAHRDLVYAHVPGHALIRKSARRERRRANRTLHLKHVPVCRWTAAEMMAPHDAGKTASLADTDHVNVAFAVENIHQHLVADLHRAVAACRRAVAAFSRLFRRCRCSFRSAFHRDFAHKFHWRQVVLGEMTLHRLADVLALDELHQPDLRSFVSIFVRALELRDYARPRLQNRDRVDFTPVIEDLRHADFFTENSVNHCFS